jgi:hypothetical protein
VGGHRQSPARFRIPARFRCHLYTSFRTCPRSPDIYNPHLLSMRSPGPNGRGPPGPRAPARHACERTSTCPGQIRGHGRPLEPASTQGRSGLAAAARAGAGIAGVRYYASHCTSQVGCGEIPVIKERARARALICPGIGTPQRQRRAARAPRPAPTPWRQAGGAGRLPPREPCSVPLLSPACSPCSPHQTQNERQTCPGPSTPVC